MITVENAVSLAKAIPRFETEALLAHVLKVSRAHLYASPERILSLSEETVFKQGIERRLQGEPLSYLTGLCEFWSLDFAVTPDTLIPRPETELLVELTLKKWHNRPATIADLGTGSGALALSLAKERPDFTIYATDKSLAALGVAKDNAKRLCLPQVTFLQGDWCQALPKRIFDAIISNPPYVEEDYFQSNQQTLRFEPREALLSGEEGLQDIRRIITEASFYLADKGCLLLEHGFKQAQQVRGIFEKAGYTNMSTYQDLSGLDRVTEGEWRWQRKIF